MLNAVSTPRYARPSDALALNGFARAQFEATFGAANSPADMADYLDEAFTDDAMVAMIGSREHGVLVVEAGPDFAGYAAIATDSTQSGRRVATVQRFYLDKAWHGSGLAARLMDEIVEHALAIEATVLRLGVWERNQRAIRYYEKSGFDVTGEQHFQLGSDRQRDLIMERSLTRQPPDDRVFVARFMACRWPPAAWTHRAHVRLAWTLLGEHGLAAALSQVSDAIRRYNSEVLERPHAYHETLTQAFVRLIAAVYQTGERFDQFCHRQPGLLATTPLAIARYYSDALLASTAARHTFVAPDREPLPPASADAVAIVRSYVEVGRTKGPPDA